MLNELNNRRDTFESLEDAISFYLQSDKGDLYMLEEYIECMPNTRESVNEMLEAITSYDLLAIYTKLFTECSSLLSEDEMDKLKKDYKDNFSV